MKFAVGLRWGLVCVLLAGCSSSLYGWQVRTTSTPLPPAFRPAQVMQGSTAVFSAVTSPALRGNEMTLPYYLIFVLKKLNPDFKVLSPIDVITRMNREGVAAAYVQLKLDYEQSNILERDPLRKIATAIGVRYVLIPRLAAFSQTAEDRWTFPPFAFRLSHTRSSIMRLSLQLWDAETGELVWGSAAEATMQNEALSEDPVYLEDIARVALGSMVADFMHRKTASRYTPVNTALNDLIEDLGKNDTRVDKPIEPSAPESK